MGKFKRPVVISAVISIGLLYSVVIINRNQVWKDDYTLYSEMARKSPEADLPHYNLGIAYADKGMLDDATRESRTALMIDPNHADARKNLYFFLKY